MNMPAAGAMTITMGIQTANSVDAPDTPVVLASSRTNDGLTFPGAAADKSSNTGNKQFVRGVYLAKNTSGDSTVRYAWVAGSIEVVKK